jgi:SAM-dependent methyltransferase
MNKIEYQEIKKCEICGSHKTDTFLEAVDRNYLNEGVFRYIKCTKCNFVWLSPRPDKNSVFKFYPTSYGPYKRLSKPSGLQSLVRSLIKNNSLIAKALIKDQLFFINPKGKLLDVGTGNGHYLDILLSWGWDAYGVEPDNRTVERLKKRGIKNIFKGDIFTVKFPANNFDLIRYSHVLEHVPSPKRELERANKLLKKGGLIYIYLPNIDSLFFQLFKSYWYPLEPPRHFYQFSPETITALLKKAGFKNVQIKYNQSPYTFLWSLFYLLDIKNGDKRLGIITYPLGVVLRILNLIKKADVIEITATK